MDQDIVRNHAAVSIAGQAFLDYAVVKANCLEPVALLDDSLPPLFRNYQYPLHSWPWFLGEEMRKILEDCACQVPRLVQRAIEVEFGDDYQRLAGYFGLSELAAELYMAVGVDPSQLMHRTDAILTEDGLKIMEINVGSNIGGWQIQWMDALYRKHPSLQEFFGQVRCESKDIPLAYMTQIVESARAVSDDGDAAVHAFVLVPADFMEIADSEQTINAVFQAAAAACGCRGVMHFASDYAALKFTPAGVYLDELRITAIVSSFPGDDGPTQPKELFRAYLGGQVAWPDNPFIVPIRDKRSLALLHKHKESPAFNEQERRLIDYFIPWGSDVSPKHVEFKGTRVDLETLLLQCREKFVIKIAYGAQGNDVHVGRFKNDEEWAKVVAQALREPGWLAQEFCSSLPFYGQSGSRGYQLHDVVWGVFGFGTKYGGCWLRLMKRGDSDGVINSAKGAQETIVYEVFA
ncbi:hypothetical protein [Stenotrophomonas tuberculopleuritidis]|uniref:hypothetical protein n=1 Tax=Stenotrophomonas tuberculopleuritidis TaxID=3055079 RepID=UPI0026E5238E|nr:hypothetical protein [Stenotrophomonas sp. 704A1]